MSLPYENAISGNNAIKEIQKMLRGFGCSKFATGEDSASAPAAPGKIIKSSRNKDLILDFSKQYYE